MSRRCRRRRPVPPRDLAGALNLVGSAVVLVGLSPVEGRGTPAALSPVNFDEKTAALVLHRACDRWPGWAVSVAGTVGDLDSVFASGRSGASGSCSRRDFVLGVVLHTCCCEVGAMCVGP